MMVLVMVMLDYLGLVLVRVMLVIALFRLMVLWDGLRLSVMVKGLVL